MKQETKNKLKKIYKICVYLALPLLWLVSLIGVSAYSVYWIKQNTNYEMEVLKRDIKPKYALNDNSLSFYSLKPKTFLDADLTYRGNEQSYGNYFYVDQGANGHIVYSYDGDFLISRQDTFVEYHSIIFHFKSVDAETFTLSYIQLVSSNSSAYVYNQTSNIYLDVVLRFGSIYVNNNYSYGIHEMQEFGVLKYCMNELFDTNGSFTFTFQSGSRNLPNYLSSYTRLQYGQVVLADTTPTWGLTIPMVFECNGVLYDNITLLYYDCLFYYNSAGQVINNYEMFLGSNMNMPKICRYVLFGRYGKTLDYSIDSDGNLASVSNGSLAMFMSYSGTQDLVVSESVTWHVPVYQVVQGLQVNSNFATIHVKDVDSVPFVNSTGVNLLPYNNISIRDILGSYFNFYGDINGYNGTNYDVGLGNVFILISDAFQSMIPLLAIQVIPGITLGLLVLLPLVVTIILVILKLVKK